MRFIDVTLPIHAGMAGYPGDPPVEVRRWRSIEAGAAFNVGDLRLGSHAGTHVDAPLHCLPAGAPVDALPLDALCGPALVLELPRGGDRHAVDAALAAAPRECRRLLLRIGNPWAQRSAAEDWLGLSVEQAQALVERGLRLVGVDRLSIAAGDATLPVHRLLLTHGIVILEGLDLRAAPAGACGLLCLPLKLAGGDGAPARVVLTRDD